MQEKVALPFLGLTNPQYHHTENSPPSKQTLVQETDKYLRCQPLHKNTQREILRRRPKNDNKARIKLSEAILSTLGDCWEKIYLLLTPSKTDGRVSSQQGAPTTYNLTYWEVYQQTYVKTLLASLGVVIGQNSDFQQGGLEGKWVWPRGEIHPFGGGGGGKEVFHKEHIPVILDINCLTHPELSFAQQHFPSKDIFQPAKICLKNRYFEETYPLGAPACHTGRPTTSFKVTLRESGSLHWGLLWLSTPPYKGDSIAPLHTRNKVPEKLVLQRNKRTKQAMRR